MNGIAPDNATAVAEIARTCRNLRHFAEQAGLPLLARLLSLVILQAEKTRRHQS
jgi:hypothetical protein